MLELNFLSLAHDQHNDWVGMKKSARETAAVYFSQQRQPQLVHDVIAMAIFRLRFTPLFLRSAQLAHSVELRYL